MRALPVVIEDSHTAWTMDRIDALIDTLNEMDESVEPQPCNVLTNMMMRPYHSLNSLLQLASTTDHWFIHFRNCEFEAVKWSRTIVERPYYLSLHLNPFEFSWIILSKNYTRMQHYKMLDIRRVGLVMQLYGRIEILLKPINECVDFCQTHAIILDAGQALLFTTELWQFSYKLTGDNQRDTWTTTFIQEIDWFN